MTFHQGQIDYFGKKGMTLHVDIIVTMVNMKLQKNIYFTSVKTVDRDAKDVLALADNILKKLQVEFPHIDKTYAKSDYESCYHSFLGPEALYRLCKNYVIDLCRYDFNEPCKGKEQCDRESASAKTVLRSYLQAENNLFTADNIAEGICSGFGV